ncbi:MULTISPECIES: 2-oxoglutarate dehydrogenase E1 component [Methylococcus]|uniref:2-oxoglutarate dehydrogenase E1 component n=1 Tax=Methylococcus TaxID=413 RepID=UPI002FDABC9C
MSTQSGLFPNSTAFSEDNAGFVEALYEQYLRDPETVAPDWREKFRAFREGRPAERAIPPLTVDVDRAVRKQAAVDRLIDQYRTHGHLSADNNPLKPASPSRDLEPARYGLDATDMDAVFYLDILQSDEKLPLRDILDTLQATYCRHVGVEYMHIMDSEIREWLRRKLEGSRAQGDFDTEQKRELLRLLTAAEGIEKHLHRKYVGQKRFSLEGAESLIPLLDELIQRCGAKGTREVVLGMAHRGRLNVLINILGKKPELLFREFEGTESHEGGSGDVKYHLGFSSDVASPGGPVHLTLAFNPSHLEIIDPVVEGSVRARQDRLAGDAEAAVVPVLIHGDAAFAGQGVVMETLNMAETRAYTTGGTIHIVINNQIGFTTSNPFDARSTLYCTDVANMIQAPVFHVNGDDPEAVLYVTRLAVDYRMKFRRDVVIDLLCYRRHGHNEADEPAVTQPLMYRFIRRHPPVRALYAERLIAEGIVTPDEPARMEQDYQDALARGEPVSRPLLGDSAGYVKTRWDRYRDTDWTAAAETGLPMADLAAIAERMTALPAGFEAHARVEAIHTARRRMAAGELPADWGFGETLAYASLLWEGRNVRLTGQDVGRGTFFHRHAIVHDQRTGEVCAPLQHLRAGQGRFDIYDSLLSEEGVLGFEYGYSSSEPDTLVIWEAQFGDFANNAQVVIDQFISSGETKWGRLSGLTLLLPHGYEGQGPEHSSARLERYLQLCAGDNIQVCVPTTPAQIFHLLRRQLLRPYRRPLIVLTPKSLLRHKLATSSLSEFAQGRFRCVIDETDRHEPARITRLVLCAGKVYYDLLETRRRYQTNHVALVRIEQLYPFPRNDFLAMLKRYPNLQELIWCQEEPENQGAWHQIKHRFPGILDRPFDIGYAGPPMSASPAVGHFRQHIEQQKMLVERALVLPVTPTATTEIAHAHRNQCASSA